MWIEIGKTIIEIFTKRKEMKVETKTRLSEVFLSMSKILEETVRLIQSDVYPHGKCAAMEDLSKELMVMVVKTGELDPQKVNDLQSMLMESSRLEMEFANRKDPATIETLLKTAGKFEALSIMIKI